MIRDASRVVAERAPVVDPAIWTRALFRALRPGQNRDPVATKKVAKQEPAEEAGGPVRRMCGPCSRDGPPTSPLFTPGAAVPARAVHPGSTRTAA